MTPASARPKTAWTTALDPALAQGFRVRNWIDASARMDETIRIAGRTARIEANEHGRTEAPEHLGNRLVVTGQTMVLEVFTATLVGVTHLVVRRRSPARIADIKAVSDPDLPDRHRLPRGRGCNQTFHILRSGAKSGPCPSW